MLHVVSTEVVWNFTDKNRGGRTITLKDERGPNQ